ncbi:MAG: hypothetical protein O7G83_03880 [Proteobacteria bacterium]|nr:hypothetical protein [Pseudomonadota bacterium]
MNSSAALDQIPVPTGAIQTAVPVLGHTVERLEDLRHRASTSMAHLIQLAESDPSLTLNLFLTANEHLERANRPPAALIQHAILVLGVAAFNKRFTALPRLEAFSEGDETQVLVEILATGHHAARQARTLAELTPAISSSEVMAAALAEQATDYLNVLGKRPIPGFARPGHDRVLASLPPLVRVVGAESTARKCMDYGARVAHAVSDCWDEERLAPLYEDIAACFAREPAAIERIIKRTAVTTAREAMHFRCRPAAIHLISPGPPPHAAKPAAAKPAIKLARRVKEPRADGDRIEEVLNQLAVAIKHSRSSRAALSLALQSICRCTGYRLGALLVRDKRSGALVLRINEGAKLPEAYVDMRLSPTDNPLLKKLLRKEAALELDATADPRLAGMLEAKLRRLIGSHKACLYSVFVGDKALGIVMACRPSQKIQSHDTSFDTFKQICRLTGQGLEDLRQSSRASA